MQTKTKIIPGTYDAMFKEILTAKEVKTYAAKILSYFLNIEEKEIINEMEVLNNELNKNNHKEKGKRCDVILKCRDVIINFEMNKTHYKGLEEKNLRYILSLYNRAYEKGDKITRKILIQVNVNDYNEEKTIEEYVLRNKEGKVYNESLKIYTVSLEKIRYKYYNKEELSEIEKSFLMICMEDLEELEEISKGDETLKKVVNLIERLSQDEGWLSEFDYEEELKLEKMLLEEHYKEQGLEQGLEQGKIEVAKNMINMNMDLETISKATGMSIDEIKKLD